MLVTLPMAPRSPENHMTVLNDVGTRFMRERLIIKEMTEMFMKRATSKITKFKLSAANPIDCSLYERPKAATPMIRKATDSNISDTVDARFFTSL